MNQQLITLESLMSVITTNHAEISSTLISTNQKMDKIVEDISAKIANVEKLMNAKIDEMHYTTSSRLNATEIRLSTVEQALERSKKVGDFVIFGIPNQAPEDLRLILNKMCIKIDIELLPCNTAIFRVGKSLSNGRPSPVLLKIGDRMLSRNFFSQYISCSPPLKLSDIGFKSSERIFINHSLSQYDSVIYKKALELKKANMIHQIIVEDGVVHIKTDRLAKKNPIFSVAEFDNFVGETSSSSTRTGKRKPSSPPSFQQPTKSSIVKTN